MYYPQVQWLFFRSSSSLFPIINDKRSRPFIGFMSKVMYKAGCWDYNSFYIGKQSSGCMTGIKTGRFKALTSTRHSSAVADHKTLTGHRIKWHHFDISATGRNAYTVLYFG